MSHEIELNGASENPGATARMNAAAAFSIGIWYSLVLASAMTVGVKYLHPDTPKEHNILQSVAWTIGLGMGVALSGVLSRQHRLQVGICCTLTFVSSWLVLLYYLRNSLKAAEEVGTFGGSIPLVDLLVGFAVVILVVGMTCAFWGARWPRNDEWTTVLLGLRSGHWWWLWIAAFGWVSMLPVAAYYFWLQFATAIYSILHPSLWPQEGSGLFFGLLGILALGKGIEISLRSVSDKGSYSAIVWKRALVFLFGSGVLAGVVSAFLLNIDIDRLKSIPESMGSHPWWIL